MTTETAHAPIYVTREEWLMAAATRLAGAFTAAGHGLPDRLRITCGWPSSGGTGRTRRVLGECWATEASADGTAEVFIAPTLAGPREVFAVLVHELIHAAIGVKAKHGPQFKKMMRALGLAGKATATIPADDFDARYGDDLVRLGAFPHAALSPALSGRKVEGTRMLKACCPACEYTVRISKKWADVGLPACPCGAGDLALEDAGEDPA